MYSRVRPEDLYENFVIYFPSISNHVIRWKVCRPYILELEMDDGRICEYNDLMHSIRNVKEYDDTEERWLFEFSLRLDELMMQRGYNQFTLSDDTGISQASISKYLNRQVMPSAYVAVKLAKALDCSLDDLIMFN